MINKRLTLFLESNNHIMRFQSGFRSDRSTTDNLVRLETLQAPSIPGVGSKVIFSESSHVAYQLKWNGA